MPENSLLSRLKGKLIIGLAIGGLVYLLVVVYSGWDKLSLALAGFPWRLFPLLLVLAFANYVFRFFKWNYYVRTLQIKLRNRDSFIIFMSGLIMTISPGKVGELLKAVLLKEVNQTPISVSAPIVVAERLTDFVALIVLSVAGLMVFSVENSSLVVLGAVALILLAIVGVTSNRRLSLGLIGLLERWGVSGRFGHRLHRAYESIYRLVRLGPLTVATFWSLLAWACECTGFWITLKAFTPHPNLLAASFIYALGTIIGVASPGGLGLTEGSMVVMLQNNSIMTGAALAKPDAGAATLIIRLATLWFAVFVGATVLLLFQKRFGGAAQDLETELAKETR